MRNMWEQFRKMPTRSQVIIGGFVIVFVLGGIGTAIDAVSGSGKSSDNATTTTSTATTQKPKPKGDQTVNKNTRFYLNEMNTCEVGVGLVLLDIRKQEADIALADDTTQARDLCEGVRDKLLLSDTDHFDDEAALGFHAIDRYKSGLNALLAYIDNPRPTKILEARDKLQEGNQSAHQAEREINQRRRVYGLRRYSP